ncbi:MAG: sigma-70 family RNA polymerase sigma factor [Planctomycetes bacterium]|nr:sigma-70 family RNA polymerase sigma factor [Planctomycetota bacterium]
MDRHDEFMRLFLRHQSEIRAFIGSLVRDRHAREDVFQEVSLILWRQYETYDASRSFGAWARGIAANKVLQAYDKSVRTPVAFSPEAVQAILDAHDRTEQDSPLQADALNRCIEHLPEKSRELLVLRYEQSLRLEVVAQRVKSTLHAVHMALSRIRTRLAECIEQRMKITGGV